MECYLNGSKYDGYFKEGKRNGVGFMEYSSQLGYIGEWRDGMKHGNGIVEMKNKKIYGVFEEDQYKESLQGNYSFTEKLINDILPEDV